MHVKYTIATAYSSVCLFGKLWHLDLEELAAVFDRYG